jgi:hypothetical protein
MREVGMDGNKPLSHINDADDAPSPARPPSTSGAFNRRPSVSTPTRLPEPFGGLMQELRDQGDVPQNVLDEAEREAQGQEQTAERSTSEEDAAAHLLMQISRG